MPFTAPSSVDTPSQQLYYRWHPATGRDGTTLVLIHGLGSSHAFYETIIPSLVEKGYSCLAFDTPGSGLSQPGRDMTPAEIAHAILSHALKIIPAGERMVVVGHSMGSMVAAEMALQHPLRAVIMIGPVHPTPALGDIFHQRILTVRESGLEPLADVIPKAATGSRAQPTQKAFIRALILSQTPEGYTSLCGTIAGAQPPQYDRAECPLLIIAGAEDKTSPLQGCETIKTSWGKGAVEKKLEVIEGVGHWHCIEAPEDVQDLVYSFVNGL